MSGNVSSAYFCGKGLLAKAVQFLHLLDVQQLCFSSLHSTGEQRSNITKQATSFLMFHKAASTSGSCAPPRPSLSTPPALRLQLASSGTDEEDEEHGR